MTRVIKQTVVTILFIALLTFTAVKGDAWDRFLTWMSGQPRELTPLTPEESLKRYGFYLRDGAKAAGIDFVHQVPTQMDAQLAHIMPLIVSMGAGVSVVDFDRDGLLDIYV